MKLLIICDPDDQNATELSLFLKSEAEKLNRRVLLFNASQGSPIPGGFDCIIVAASVQDDNIQPVMENYLINHGEKFSGTPWFLLAPYNCFDNADLRVPKPVEEMTRKFLDQIHLKPQQQLYIGVGTRMENNRYVTNTDWAGLKMALQQFVIKNDLMMA